MSEILKVLVFDRDIKPNENPITDVFEPYRKQGFFLVLFPYKDDQDEQVLDVIESGDTPENTEELVSVLRDILLSENKEFKEKDDYEGVFHVCHMEHTTKQDFYDMFRGENGHYTIKEFFLTELEVISA